MSAVGWSELLAPKGRWSALVVQGSCPATVARRQAGGVAFVAAPFEGVVMFAGRWSAERAARMALMTAREVMRLRVEGVTALCPALMQVAMAEVAPLLPDAPGLADRRGWDAWVRPMLDGARQLVVPDLPGWDRDPVVLAQVGVALARNVTVHVYARGRG